MTVITDVSPILQLCLHIICNCDDERATDEWLGRVNGRKAGWTEGGEGERGALALLASSHIDRQPSILVPLYYPLLTTGCAGVSCCISESIRHLIDRFPAEYRVILDDARGRL